MSETDIAEILKLPAEERLRLIEAIWESLTQEAASVPLGDAHRKELAERLAEDEQFPDDVISRDEVMREARRG